jgi:hypothetical protein
MSYEGDSFFLISNYEDNASNLEYISIIYFVSNRYYKLLITRSAKKT